MASPEFNTIELAISNRQSITASYKGGALRELCPHVLGVSPASDQDTRSDETVLCYQFGGYSPMPLDSNHPSRKNWRCFKVKDLTNVQIMSAPVGSHTPPNYAKVKRQNNVMTVKKKRT